MMHKWGRRGASGALDTTLHCVTLGTDHNQDEWDNTQRTCVDWLIWMLRYVCRTLAMAQSQVVLWDSSIDAILTAIAPWNRMSVWLIGQLRSRWCTVRNQCTSAVRWRPMRRDFLRLVCSAFLVTAYRVSINHSDTRTRFVLDRMSCLLLSRVY